MFSRRDFMKGLVAAGGVLFAPFDRFMPVAANLVSSSSFKGEVYKGFILLPDGSPVPPIVTPPKLGIPIMCGTGVGRGGPAPTALNEVVPNIEYLRQLVPFKMFGFRTLPREFEVIHSLVTRHETGEVFEAAIVYGVQDSIASGPDSERRTIRITAQPDYPRPFPLWSSNAVETDGPAVILEKVDFLPTSGIMIAVEEGYVFHWIQEEILYTLYAEWPEPLTDVQALLSQLTA